MFCKVFIEISCVYLRTIKLNLANSAQYAVTYYITHRQKNDTQYEIVPN